MENVWDYNFVLKIFSEKTTKMLFNAQQSQNTASDNNKPMSTVPLPLWKLVSIRGNGDVESLPCPDGVDEDDPTNEFLWVKRQSKCCDRKSYVQSHCGNQCSKDLCEFCGYSCIECGVFLCNFCVDIL